MSAPRRIFLTVAFLGLLAMSAHAQLKPSESVPTFKVNDDLKLDQLLAEPDVAQPVFLNFDERGRMWVVQYRQYPWPAGLNMVSRDSVWRAVYDKVPPAPPNHIKGADKITIHEDTNGDGRFDKQKTFLEGLNIATSVEFGRGGVWVLNPPYLLFYPDANRDDIPDSDPIVELSGFGLEDTHSVANSLRWGPDGWLYGAQGSTVTAQILRRGISEEPIYSQGQNIWRYHPETRKYEVFAEGGGNAFGVEIDDKGRIYSGHNGGGTRGFHYVQGGYLRKGFNKHGPLSNPYAYGYFPHMEHHNVERFTHNFIIYEADTLPANYHGKLFGVEPLQGRIVLSDFLPDQSTFKTRDLGHPVTTSDRWFSPVDIKTGPDGAIYICDWYDGQVNHYRNHEGKIDTTNGRIYRLRGSEMTSSRITDLSAKSSQELVTLLRHKNKWHRQTALRLLGDRKDRSVISQLRRQLRDSRGQVALETLWALNLSRGFNRSTALRSLDHPDPHVRLWTVRLLADDRRSDPAIIRKLIALAESEPNLEVRSQLACSARRLIGTECLAIVENLLTHDEDTGDKRIPLLLWWAIESKADSNREDVLALFESSPFWDQAIVKDHIVERVSRRYAQSGKRGDLLAVAQLFDRAPSATHASKLTEGFEAAFKGRSTAALPEPLLKAMARHGSQSMALKLRQGNEEAIMEAIKVVANGNTDIAKRIDYVGLLGEVRATQSESTLLTLLDNTNDSDLQTALLAALSNFRSDQIGMRVTARFLNIEKEALPTAQTLLTTRAPWALAFASAVKNKTIPREKVPHSMVAKMKLIRDKDVAAITTEVWGAAGSPPTEEMEKTIKRLTAVIDQKKGSPYKGRTLYNNNCAVCHTLFAAGGQIGPELTTYQRTDLANMLLSIVNPNAEIREGYENFLVETKDERVLTGFLAEEDQRQIVLRSFDGQSVTVARDEITTMTSAGMSLMPEGLLETMTDQQIRDLFAYLRSTQPLVGSE